MNSILFSSFRFPSPSIPRCRLPQLQSLPLHSNTHHYHHRSNHRLNQPLTSSSSLRHHPHPHPHPSYICSTAPSNEGTVSVMDLVEKDYSFLDIDDTSSIREKISRIISAGEIKEDSKVLVSFGSESFVDTLVETRPCQLLLVVHDSLFVLACIKEKYDKVKCWQGELVYVPKKWAPLDVVFLYFIPALPFTLDQVFEALAKRCLSGARVVISHPQGRQVLQQQRKEFSDAIVSDLPDKITLQKAAASHSFELVEFVDEPGFFLAVLKFNSA